MKRLKKFTVFLIWIFLLFSVFVQAFHHHNINELHNNCNICIFISGFFTISISLFFLLFFFKIKLINLIYSQLYQIINFSQINARGPPFLKNN